MNSEEIKPGLSSQEAEELLRKHGKNILRAEKKRSALSVLLSQYKDLITFILLSAGGFSLFIKEYTDAFFVFLVLVMNGFFGFIQEYRAEKTLEKLKQLTVPICKVRRNGEELELPAEELVPGDIVLLHEGDKVPADGVLETGVALELDESILTGESLPVEKKKGDEMYAGTFVVKGRDEMRVTATGSLTRLGQVAKEIEETSKPTTPLASNLSSLGKKLVFGGIALCVILVPVGILQGREFKELVLTTISLSVAVIPTGLPLVITVALAVGVYRMAKEKAIVRKMAAIETLGSTNLILTDKTGTITQNVMSVKKHWLLDDKSMPLLLRAMILGNTAEFAVKEDGGSYDIIGDKTDGAFLLFANSQIKDLDSYKKEGHVVEEKPFDADKKIIEVTWEHQGSRSTFVRGAPETILTLIKPHEVEKVKEEVEKMAKEGLRVIGFAQKHHGDNKFTFLGLLGIYDPPRKEAIDAIKKAKEAGIRVVMVTGDNPVTALAISQEIGLVEEGELVVTSQEIAKLPDEELLPMLPQIRVFARMLPEDKLRLVRLYKRAGFIVAVTGDGVNDALALSEAHVGVAMGKSGTDVAKEAADVVITDDDLHTIVQAVEEGRGIFDNIVKVVVFLLSSNFAEFLIIFFGIMFGLPIPLSPTQILWVNLISDGLPGLVLATDIKRRDLLKNKPRNVSENIINSKRLQFVLWITIPFSLFLFGLYVISLNFFSHHDARLIVFNMLVAGEMIIVFIARGGLYPVNKSLLLAIAISLLLQIIITFVPSMRVIFS